MLSFGIFSARAAITAARSRGFMAGSGMPSLAATVISRASLPNSLDFAASCRPLRCMMFLNWEWPAMLFSSTPAPRRTMRARRSGENRLIRGVIERARHKIQIAPRPAATGALPFRGRAQAWSEHELHRRRHVAIAVAELGEL